MSNAKKEPGLASLVIVLAIICLVIAALLGLVNSVTEGPIADNTAKTVQDSLKIVLPADTYDEVEYSGTEANVIAVYKAGADGYVVEVMKMENNINAECDGAITGIAIISHSETSGLGSKATDPEWQAQFAGITDTVTVTKDGGQINAITGSTITSRAVCDGVNMARSVVEELG